MALNGSGQLSLGGSTSGQSIALELGQSATGQISLNDSAVRTLAGIASGAIILPTSFYGKSSSGVQLISYTVDDVSGSSTTFTRTSPSGQSGDLLLVCVDVANYGFVSSVSTGFTAIGGASWVATHYKRTNSTSESVSVTVDRTFGYTWGVSIFRFRKAFSASTPGGSGYTGGDGSSISFQLTSPITGDYVLNYITITLNSVSFTTPTNYSALYNDSDATGLSRSFSYKMDSAPSASSTMSGVSGRSNVTSTIQVRIIQTDTAAPTVTSVSPSSGASGETVTITGTNFNSTTAVSIGGTAVTSFTVLSSTSISAVLGSRANGTGLSVLVTNSIGTNAGNSLFSYITRTYTQITSGLTYSVSGTYSSNSPPTYQYMNNNIANGSSNGNQWGSDGGNPSWIKVDMGSNKTIGKIVIGYDYLNNLPGGWGTPYTENLSVQTSTDNSTWTTVGTTPTYASSGAVNGLASVTFALTTARYIRLYGVGYICTLEFQVYTGA